MSLPAAKPDLTLVFDGGSLGNPGKGYGSFLLVDVAGQRDIQRLEYGNGVTNNQAEYRTFIAGLQTALEQIRTERKSPSDVCITVRTDSKLVVEQVHGRWKIRHAGLQPLAAEARRLLAQFGAWDLTWQPRQQTVRLLGH